MKLLRASEGLGAYSDRKGILFPNLAANVKRYGLGVFKVKGLLSFSFRIYYISNNVSVGTQ